MKLEDTMGIGTNFFIPNNCTGINLEKRFEKLFHILREGTRIKSIMKKWKIE
jgi:hypothetical protein